MWASKTSNGYRKRRSRTKSIQAIGRESKTCSSSYNVKQYIVTSDKIIAAMPMGRVGKNFTLLFLQFSSYVRSPVLPVSDPQPGIILQISRRLIVVPLPPRTRIFPISTNIQRIQDVPLALEKLSTQAASDMECLSRHTVVSQYCLKQFPIEYVFGDTNLRYDNASTKPPGCP